MLSIFKIIAKLEGISLLVLLLFAMPMKYALNQPIYVKIVGMSHGFLFISYIFIAVILKMQENWNLKKLGIICLASVIPFGTFYVEKKYFKNV